MSLVARLFGKISALTYQGWLMLGGQGPNAPVVPSSRFSCRHGAAASQTRVVWPIFAEIHSSFLVARVPSRQGSDRSDLKPAWNISRDLDRAAHWLTFPLSIRSALSGCPEGLWGTEKGRRVEETGACCVRFLSDERKTGEGHNAAVLSSV